MNLGGIMNPFPSQENTTLFSCPIIRAYTRPSDDDMPVDFFSLTAKRYKYSMHCKLTVYTVHYTGCCWRDNRRQLLPCCLEIKNCDSNGNAVNQILNTIFGSKIQPVLSADELL